MNLVVVSFGMGNTGSVVNMLRRIGVDAVVSGDPAIVASADRLILPGVGAFDAAMRNLDTSGLRQALDQRVAADGVPVLGICLGMQLLAEHGDEGGVAGLAWLPGRVERLAGVAPDGAQLPLPHIGWSTLSVHRPSPLLAGLAAEDRFYFVHSFHHRAREEHLVASASHGEPFAAVVSRGNIHGVQFHPEKSHRPGLRLLENFLGL